MISRPLIGTGTALAPALILFGILLMVRPGSALAGDQSTGQGADSEYTLEDCLDCHNADHKETAESSLLISYDRYRLSPHGKALACLSCHTGITGEEHMEGGGTAPVNCIGCHDAKKPQRNPLSRLLTFRIASHGKADLSGRYTTDNCLGCHQGTGAHGETEPVTPDNCHRCHSPDLPSPLWGKFHSGKDTNLNNNRKNSL